MPRIASRRIAGFLLLALLLLPAFAGAAERRSEIGPAPREKAVLWQGGFLTTVWGMLTRIWDAAGSSLDPDGQPRPNEGSSLDPSGSTADAGGSLDPDGSTADNGGSLDPNGGV